MHVCLVNLILMSPHVNCRKSRPICNSFPEFILLKVVKCYADDGPFFERKWKLSIVRKQQEYYFSNDVKHF